MTILHGNKVNNQDISCGVEVTGSIAEALAAMGKRVSKQVLLDAVKAGGGIVAESIGARCPVDKGVLRDNLAVEVGSSNNGVSATVGFLDPFQASIAYWVEHGHNNREAKTAIQKFFKQKGTSIGMVPAHPFFRPGIDSSIAAASEAVMSVIWTAIQKDESTSTEVEA